MNERSRIQPAGGGAPTERAVPDNVDDLIDRIIVGYERQSRIIRGIGHDFKSPLASISLMVEILLGNDLGPLTERQRAGLTAVAESMEHLTRLADALYAVAESRDGSLALSVVEFDLATVVSDVLASLGAASEVRGISLSQSGPSSLPVRTDRGRVERIVSNLVQNAVKYSEGGTVSVALEVVGDRAVISVSDQGIGIAGDELPTITGPLVRGTNAGPRPGSGMGLAIVEQLALDLRGELGIESELGVGTVARVTIPVDAGDDAQ